MNFEGAVRGDRDVFEFQLFEGALQLGHFHKTEYQVDQPIDYRLLLHPRTLFCQPPQILFQFFFYITNFRTLLLLLNQDKSIPLEIIRVEGGDEGAGQLGDFLELVHEFGFALVRERRGVDGSGAEGGGGVCG